MKQQQGEVRTLDRWFTEWCRDKTRPSCGAPVIFVECLSHNRWNDRVVCRQKLKNKTKQGTATVHKCYGHCACQPYSITNHSSTGVNWAVFHIFDWTISQLFDWRASVRHHQCSNSTFSRSICCAPSLTSLLSHSLSFVFLIPCQFPQDSYISVHIFQRGAPNPEVR